jgi:predicted MFS family arabinose efflux permease
MAVTQVQRRGTARDVLGVPAFRRIFIATFISNAGRWMQMTSLGVLGWELTESPTFLGLLIFAQLAPMSVLSLIGGSLADTSNRRHLLLGTQTWQMLWTLVLAALVIDDVIAENLLLLLVFIIGIGQGLYAPIFTSILPVIAGADNIKAAVSLNSIQLNAARVIGPAAGGLLASAVGFAEVFAINGIAYLAVLFAIWRTEIPMSTARAGASFSDRVFGGFRVAWRAPQVGRPLLLMSLFAFFCLPFIGQLPAIAELNLDIDAQAPAYGWFYATFGLGGMVGAALVGTVLANVDSRLMIRVALAGFAVTLAWLASIRDLTVAYFAIFAVAVFYFSLPTVLASVWQEHVDETVRGRVSALWVLSFGGTVPVSNAIAGPIIEATSLDTVIYAGAVVAVILAAFYRLRTGPVVGEEILNDTMRSAPARPTAADAV